MTIQKKCDFDRDVPSQYSRGVKASRPSKTSEHKENKGLQSLSYVYNGA